MSLTTDILSHALSLGFVRAAVVQAGRPRYGAQFAAWLAAGYHGEMGYLAARAAERLDPGRLAPDAASMIVVALSYDPGQAPAVETAAYPDKTNLHPLSHNKKIQDEVAGQARGRIARYAIWPDYHEVIKPKLYALDAFIRARTGRQTLGKGFVDSAPVLERNFAAQAGLGFIGRNTCLITPGLGSWSFLAGLFVPERLEAGNWKLETGNWKLEAGSLAQGSNQGCGRCTRCLDTCPTHAFVSPHVLDARRCISYLTIELRGPIPRDLRPLMGNWVFGCDICQEVCPYNRGLAVEPAATSAKSTFVDSDMVGAGRLRNGRCDFQSPALSALLTLDEATFRARFRGTPVLRAKRRGLVRNACVAAGNSADAALVPALAALLSDPEPLVRGHAAWALGRIGGPEAERALTNALVQETELWAQEEIASAVTWSGK